MRVLTPLQSARAHYLDQLQVADELTAAALAYYRQREGDKLLALLIGGMLDMAESGMDAVGGILDEQGIASAAVVETSVSAIAGSAADGRPLASLLGQAQTEHQVERMVRTQLADAGRMGEALGRFARPSVTHYVRALSLPSCGRCVVLAGKPSRAGKPFLRHPQCDCISVPTNATLGPKIAMDPDEAVAKMTDAERQKAFTKAGAEAISMGADIGQVVNARRGMSTAQGSGRLSPVKMYGRDVYVTTEGATRRSVARKTMTANGLGKRAPRLMPESIIQMADGDRREAERLLKLYGYIL